MFVQVANSKNLCNQLCASEIAHQSSFHHGFAQETDKMGNIELEQGRERLNALVTVTEMSLVDANPENSLSHT